MKRFVISLLLACLMIYAEAQKLEEIFVKMPDDLIVQLEEAWRKDLVVLYKSGKPATLENTMQGRSTLQMMTNDYLLVQTTEHSVVELKLLPLVNNTYIICMIESVYGPLADSRVSFYSTEWELLSSDGLFVPVTGDWFFKEDADRMSSEFLDVVSQLDMDLVKYSLNSENTNLTAEYMTLQYIDDEYQKKAKPFLKTNPKIYEWKSGRFE